MIVRLPLSVLIITLNEEAHLRELLPELDFADEIIIVDSYSTDQTEEVAVSFPKVTFIKHRFENYTAQRNFTISQAKNDWILFLDADERLTPNLQQEILAILTEVNPKAAYLFPRKFMFKQEELNFTGWKTDKIYRLFNRKFAKYTEERLVHEKLTVTGKIGKLENKLIHYSYANFESYRQKMENYGRLKAQEKCAKGLKWTQWMAWLHPNYTFIYHYLIRFGFLDGQKGYIISKLNAYSVTVRYRELKKMQQIK